MEKLKYPIGKAVYPDPIDKRTIEKWIQEIEILPQNLSKSVQNLNEKQLNTLYRPGGWTVRQVIYHISDSHLNSYIRFKLAITEDQPVIKPYDQEKWAETADSSLFPVQDSLQFIELLHKRWVILLKSLNEEQLERGYMHPESGYVQLKKNIGLYAWHGKHHLAQVQALIKREQW
ncbi:MAG: YfiT family bacillithiol transferase [Calditrichaceae bacterium]